MNGRVSTFDAGRGLGEITAADGTVYPFHCTQIADGTRLIDVGALVRFVLIPRLGRFEAGQIAAA